MSRLSKNILYNLLGQGLVMILGFVAVKFVFTQLGEDALGIIYFSMTLSVSLYAVLELGVSSTIIRQVSAHFNDEPTYIHKLARTASLFYWGAYALLATAVYLAAPVLVEKWITLETLDVPTSTRMIQILGVGLLTVLPRSLYWSLLRGLQRMEFNNIIEVAMLGIQQLGIIVILALGGGLFDVAYWIALSFVLGLVSHALVSARFFSFRALVPGFSPAVFRRNYRYSSNMAAISTLAAVHMHADKLIVSKLFPIGIFGFYGLASLVVTKSALVASAISQAAFPSFSALFQARDHTALLIQYRKLQALLSIVTLPVFAAIPFATLPLFSFLLNAEAAQMLLLPVSLLCVGTYMHATLHIPYFFSLAVGRPDITVRASFYALFVVLPVTVVLVYFWGLTGAGMSVIFNYLFSYAYTVPRICSQCLKMPVSEWFWHTLRIAAVGAFTYGIAWLLLQNAGVDSIPFLALAYIGASIMYLAGAYWILGNEHRWVVRGFLNSMRVRLAAIL